ncbi:Fructose dehydrogenase cytochrome subunit [Defluviimonas aquaemixtae]|uniref:Fructose dehydrogenase cytochrome subunit n=1 Tax=Albidovulum aquaemixtae TaxID=1542388 RepID=A0A2R8B582_9RHOB|nr:cytochrome c [Defluviimonas aquaemixtae]SPH17776.1 Fructose dehydrogenase cytochrome subunit [Defluviimonas aquaemixtae]
MRRLLVTLLVLAAVAAAIGLYLIRPDPLPDDALAGLVGDAARGERMFWAAGCSSCHAAAEAKDDAKLVLTGGQRFPSPFGTFVAPNISNDPDHGIGGWSDLDLANAMLRGVSPHGTHYYPVFPYVSYAGAELQDVVDLRAFLATLPADPTPSASHEVGFPFSIRLGLGGWKLLFGGDGSPVVTGDLTEEETRGRYLAEVLGHCGECHTPRNALGAMERGRWLAGGPVPAGKGSFPNITPAKLDWSEADIVEYLTSGFTPDYDSAGGHMALVVQNTAKLPQEDRAAIAAYLKKVPPAE